MVDGKTIVASTAVLFSVFIQIGIGAHPTADYSSENDSCSRLEEEWEFLVEENMRLQRLESDRKVENIRLRYTLRNKERKVKTLENELRQLNELMTGTTPEDKPTTTAATQHERDILETRESQQVTTTLIGNFDHQQSHSGIAKVEDKIYVLNYRPNIIGVYENAIGFRFIKNITLSGTTQPYDIVYSSISKCVYISDADCNKEGCMWEMTTTEEHNLTQWPTSVSSPWSLSLTNEGHLLVLRQSGSEKRCSLEIYSLNATLIRSLQLPQEIKDPLHLVQTSTGNFIISHRLNNATSGPWTISQLTNNGQVINRFIARNQSEELSHPYHLSLVSDKKRLFVTDYRNQRVILFDSCNLTWIQVLANGIFNPWRLFHDASTKYLFVGQYLNPVNAYKIN